MKKALTILLFAMLNGKLFAQETLQSITDNGNTTSNSITVGSGPVNANTTKLFLRNNWGKTWAISSGANMINENDFSIWNWSDNITVPKLLINSIGDVAIGKASAAYKLDVSGIIQGSEHLRLTSISGMKKILFGNQDSGGLNVPSILGAANGNLYFGTGNNWNHAEGGDMAFRGAWTDGGLGIGTINPQAKLDIRGSIISGNPDIIIGTTGSFLQIQQGQTSGDTFSSLGAYQNGGNAWSNLVLQQGGGNIGIGTSSPDQKLTIKGGIGFEHNSSDKKLYSPVDGTLEWMTHNEAGEHGFAVSHQGTKLIYLNTNGDSYINGGNVGIGTTTPNEKLAVNGKIRAKEIKVEIANWPDYVFEDGYKPKTLVELEQFIKKNKHLPEVPSAKEVEQNGVELGEINKALLKNLEEVTLLLIQQGKQLEVLAEKLKKQEIVINSLKK